MTDPNPLLELWTAPFGLPPFAQIRAEHFEPAFRQAMAVHRDELAQLMPAIRAAGMRLDPSAPRGELPDFGPPEPAKTKGRAQPRASATAVL